MKQILPVLAFLSAFVSCVSPVLADQDPSPISVGPNERVVTIAGRPYIDQGGWHTSDFNLETFLLRQYAHSGLRYRQVAENYILKELIDHVDDKVMIYKPSIVIIQTGNEDPLALRKGEADQYPKSLEALVKALLDKKVRVILSSAVPAGSGGANDPSSPNGILKARTEAARDIALRYHVPFVDLFSEAVGWKMIGDGETHYGANDLAKSWALFQRQLRFEPYGSVSKLNYADGTAMAHGAGIAEIKKEGGDIEIKVQNEAGTGPVLLQVTQLAPGNYTVSVDGNAMGEKSPAELEHGIDLTGYLAFKTTSADWNKELRTRHEAITSLSDICAFQLPRWIEAKDFESQKQTAILNALRDLESQDAGLVEMARPLPMSIRIVKNP